jgi:hypothetical protein
MRLPGLEIVARPNYWPSFCKAFPQSNRQLGNSRGITQTFPLEFARVKPQCLIVSTRVGNRMRESCTYGSAFAEKSRREMLRLSLSAHDP